MGDDVDTEPEAASETGPRRALFHLTSSDDDAFTQMVYLLDMQDGLAAARRLQDWALDAVRPVPGERVVDVGSGTGTMARRLAALVAPADSAGDHPDGAGPGEVLGVEPHPRLRAVATERAAESAQRRVGFVDGLAGALPLDDASVDLVWCERVIQHLDDPQGALDEIARVLRPGGRAALLDSDHGSRVISDIDPDVAIAFNRGAVHVFGNPYAARFIPGQARRAGLTVDPDVGSSAFQMPPRTILDTPMLDQAAAQAVAAGTIAADVAEKAVAALRAAAERGESFMAVTVFGFIARKPERDEQR